MDIIGQRRVTAAVPVLLKSTEDADATVANASFMALGEIAGVAEIPAVVGALLKSKATGAGENALSSICARQPDPTVCAGKLLPGLNQAQGEAKLALLRTLRSAGGPQALAAVRTATTDANAAVKETAVRTLCDWTTPDALPDVVQLAKTATDAKCKILALRGQLRLIPQQKASDAQKLAALKDAMALIERPEEKRLALAALGEIPTADSLALVVPHLTGSLKEEANVAAVAIAEKIVDKNPAEVAAAMKQVQTNNKKLAQRAKQLQGQAKKK
jgi:HEAT repeat protein